MNLQKLLPATFRLVTVTLLAIFTIAPVGAQAPQPLTSSSLTIEGVTTHPVMALTPDTIKYGRENYRQHDWARRIGDDITSRAGIWLRRDADWIRRHMPGPGAAFAYGFAGCPECGGKTGTWASADCTFNYPGHVKCANGHTLPNPKYPDNGTGYRATDGRMHYFVGVYNAWAVEHFIAGAHDLAYAFSLTGDDKYATRSAEILDALADIYPTCTIGSWDYPETKPGQNSGRFNRPQYQVGRVLITLANTYDQIFHTPALQVPSVRDGLDRQQNIEGNMLKDGAWYCYTQSFNFSGLHNGLADYLKGAMVVGLVLGIPEYVEWAVDGPYGIRAMLANNIGRDGTYYETATGYSYYARFIYRGFAEYLLNHRSSTYPDGVNLYEDDRFQRFMFLLNLNTQIGGEMPSYGDAMPLTDPWEVTQKPFEKYDFECLEYLRLRTDDPAKRQPYEIVQNWLTNGAPEEHYRATTNPRWFLFHARPLDRSLLTHGPLDYINSVTQSHLLGQKGMVMLRTGTKPQETQGVMLRYGPALNHANFDDLNFAYHAFGHDLTYDLGYALGSAHVFAGWSKHTASHQLVTIDEKSQALGSAPTGGSLRLFVQGDLTQFAEASAPASYSVQKAQEYARTLVLIDDPQTTETAIQGNPNPTQPYLVDIFRVAGGTAHDSFSHSAGTSVTFGNLTVGEPTTGSLAGPQYAWGDKVLVDGDIDGQANKPYWSAPPGNGYGFLMHPRSLTPTASCWWADWQLPGEQTHVRLWFPTSENEKSITAQAPGILKNLPDATYVVRRRTAENDTANTFITVWEPYQRASTIESVEQLPLKNDANSTFPAVAIRIRHNDGREDLIYSAGDDNPRTIAQQTVAARLLRLSTQNDHITAAEAVGLSLFSDGDQTPHRGIPRYTGTVSDLNPHTGVIQTSAHIPADRIQAQIITFNNTAYTRNTAYQIKSAENFSTGTVIHLTEDAILGRGIVDTVNHTSATITSLISHEYAKGVRRTGTSGFFTGKTIVNNTTNARSLIQNNGVTQPLVLHVNTTTGFAPGQTFEYHDVSPGDTLEIHTHNRWR